MLCVIGPSRSAIVVKGADRSAASSSPLEVKPKNLLGVASRLVAWEPKNQEANPNKIGRAHV